MSMSVNVIALHAFKTHAPEVMMEPSIREAARRYLQGGWSQLLRLPPRSKSPAARKSFAELTITLDNVDTLRAEENIGGLFTTDGKRKDLDLDYQTAIDLAREFGLPESTASFGRPSVGVGHLIYDAPGTKAKKFKLPDGDYPKPLPVHDGQPSLMVMEIRGADKTYTMMPPSVHPSGEIVFWHGGWREPAVTDADTLRRAAGCLALAATVLYFYPQNASSCFEVRMALAGTLLRSGMAPGQVEQYVQTVARLGGDPRWEEDFVADTERRLESGRSATGVPKLVEALGLPQTCERTFRDWLRIDDRLILDPQDPMPSARELVGNNFIVDQHRTLHRYRGAFWFWTGSYYLLADDEVIDAKIWTFLERALRSADKPFKPDRSKVGNVAAALAAVCQLDEQIETPAWLTDHSIPPGELFACGNGLLHLPTGELHPVSPDYFNLNASEVLFDPNAPEPTQWLGFVKQLFGDDIQSIELLQEKFGYFISSDTSQQKISLIVGPKRSGKGTIARILTKLLGRNSVVGPTMSSLSENFGLEPLIAKSVAIISDARIGTRTDKSIIVERLLSISGEDGITVPRKYRKAWHGQLGVRFVVLTNELPSLSDGSGALAGRFMLLNLIRSFYGKEDLLLTDKLSTELSGILNWSIAGYRRLQQRRHFIQPASSLEAIEEIEMLAAPVKAFIRDCCDVGPNYTVLLDDLWNCWATWSQRQGRLDTGTVQWFGRNLRTAVPGVIAKQGRNRLERERFYSGLQLKPIRTAPIRTAHSC